MRLQTLTAIGRLGLVALVGLIGFRAAPVGPPNVLLISLDTVRADHLSLYGHDKPTSPNLARFAARGTIFEAATSQGNESLYGHATLFTGHYPSEVARPDYRTYAIPPGATLLSERLKAQGYATGAFSAGGHVVPIFGFDQGFDTFAKPNGLVFASLDFTAPKALAWIGAQAKSAPWFAFVHSYDAHLPYEASAEDLHRFDEGTGAPLAELLLDTPLSLELVRGRTWFADRRPEDFNHRVGRPVLATSIYEDMAEVRPGETTHTLTDADVRHIQGHYDGALAHMDRQLGVFLDALDARGKLDNTLVIITADHGEDLLDHGFMNHRTGLTDSITRVPLVVVGPGFGSRNHPGQVELRDVAPTILQAVGLPPGDLGGTPLQGLPSKPHVFSEGVMDMVSVRTPTHHLIHRGAPLGSPSYGASIRSSPLVGSGAFALHDLHADPGEQINLLDRPTPEVIARAKKLQEILARWRDDLETAHHALAPGTIDPATKKAFQDAGYW